MHKQLLLIGMLFSATAFSQNAGSGKQVTIPSAPNTITIQNRTSINYVPDEIDVNITLLEYVKTDPESQQTNTIHMDELEKQLIEKLNPFGLKESDLTLTNIYDMAPTQNNMYGQPQLYTNTQKRQLKKSVSLVWKKNASELKNFMEAMRFTGVHSIFITSSISDQKKKELNEQLMDKVMKEALEQAKNLAGISNKTLGDVVSVNIDPIATGALITENSVYPYYNNYNSFYGTNNGQLSNSTISMSASVVYEINEK
jgi:uncharacterized protein YggE